MSFSGDQAKHKEVQLRLKWSNKAYQAVLDAFMSFSGDQAKHKEVQLRLKWSN